MRRDRERWRTRQLSYDWIQATTRYGTRPSAAIGIDTSVKGRANKIWLKRIDSARREVNVLVNVAETSERAPIRRRVCDSRSKNRKSVRIRIQPATSSFNIRFATNFLFILRSVRFQFTRVARCHNGIPSVAWEQTDTARTTRTRRFAATSWTLVASGPFRGAGTRTSGLFALG